MPIIPLHVHSHWSLLEAVPSIGELVSSAQSAGLPALALTDANALYGAVEFSSACRQAGIRPIFGAELALAGGRSLILLAQNRDGYANLSRLVTRLQGAPDREASLARGLSLADLTERAGDLIALSGGYAGPLDAALRLGNAPRAESLAGELLAVFGRERFYVELQILSERDEAIAFKLQALADRLGAQTVATHDVRYLTPGDARRYQVLCAMREGRRLADLPPAPDLSLPSTDEMRRKFANFPGALENTERIAGQCRFDFDLGRLHFPALDLPPGRTPREELWTLARAGAAQCYGELTPELETRLRKEVDVIDTLGYTSYFLVVADIVRFAREQGVPVSPRGSASSSVAAYCLGIHDIDPIAHNLYFERFLSLERRDPPDIDLDLCSRRRDEVIDYVYRRYGVDPADSHVAMVCTYATLRPRLALREVGKAYGLSETRIKELAEHLPWFWRPAARAQTEAELVKLLQQARDPSSFDPSPSLRASGGSGQAPVEREALEMSRAMDGTPHHLSIHPGGIVISPGPIADLAPLQHATKGLLVTQFDLSGVARLGLVKIDLLGISALTVIADCVGLIRKHQPGFALESIAPDDVATGRTLSLARSIGCFQVESPGMRLTLREVSARNVTDVLIALALFRPGPLKGGLKDAFVRRHLGQEAADYLHPALQAILRETYGVILYQEQVLRIAHEVAGFTLGEADLLRRAMSKKSEREMARLHEQFIDGAQATSGINQVTAEQIWGLMAAFAGYGFPKAHAAGYAVVAYRMAYLKTHFPAEFMAARLAASGGYYSPRVYMAEARRLGLVVKPPHVNHSAEAFTLDESDPRLLRMGLGQVRDLTRATTEVIIHERPFASPEDFLARAQPLHVEAVNLVKAGALDGLGSAPALLATFDQAKWHARHSAQMGLTLTTSPLLAREPTVQERAEWEREVLGMPVSVHPLQLVAHKLAGYALTRSDQLSACAGQEVMLAGVRLAAHRFSARQQEAMLLVDMDDEAGIYQILWNGAALRDYGSILSRREPLLIRGRVGADRKGQTVVVGQEASLL